jgi:hypothetical protein
MRRRERIATGTTPEQQSYLLEKYGVLAGAEPFKGFFKDPAAGHIGDGDRTEEQKRPEPTLLPII